MRPLSNSARRARPLLGTIVEIRLPGACPNGLGAAFDAAFDVIQRVHGLMSFHEQDSDVSRLNRLAHQQPIKVHPWTYRVLETARCLWQTTGKLFDCTMAPLLIRAGYLPALHRDEPFAGDMDDVQLLPDRFVRFSRPLCIDLGGIAKGFAVDRAVDSLRDSKIAQGAVNAGGDLRLFGPLEEPVHVRDPRHPGTLRWLGNFSDISVATSAAYFSGKPFGSGSVTPIADPRRSTLCDSSRSVTVLAKDCMIADALTKPLMLTGDNGLSCLKDYRATAHVMERGAI